MTARRLFQPIKSRAYLFIGRALAVIRFNLGQSDFSGLVDHVNGRMWDAIDLLPFISRIAQSVGVDDLVFWIGEQRKVDFTLPVGLDLLGEALANIGRIDADRVELHDCFPLSGLSRTAIYPMGCSFKDCGFCLDGHFIVPYEQKTQQSSGSGLRRVWQPTHS